MKVVFTLIITLIRGLAVSPHYINKNRTRRILTSFFMKYDSSFSYDYFTSKIISILESIIYTDDRNNLTMCQNRMDEEAYSFSIKMVKCRGCGASFDATRIRYCPCCAREYDLRDNDWVVLDICKI